MAPTASFARRTAAFANPALLRIPLPGWGCLFAVKPAFRRACELPALFQVDANGLDPADRADRHDDEAVIAGLGEADAAAVGDGGFAHKGCRAFRARNYQQKPFAETERVGCYGGDADCQRVFRKTVVAAQENRRIAQGHGIGIRQADFGPGIPPDGVDIGRRRLVGRNAASGQERGDCGRSDMPCRVSQCVIGFGVLRRRCPGRPGCRLRCLRCLRCRGGGCGCCGCGFRLHG